MSNQTIKPPIKWVGGKTQLLSEILSKIPGDIPGNYYEPFIGGGAIMINYLSLIKSGEYRLSGKVIASDQNPNLIGFWRCLQTTLDSLIQELTELSSKFLSLPVSRGNLNRRPANELEASEMRENQQYFIRAKYNELSADRSQVGSPTHAAYFLFLNKAGFRGLYREGPNGFNVPYGNYKNPQFFDESHLRLLSELIRDVEFRVTDFEEICDITERGDFVYLDPPYVPLNATSFVGYTSDKFPLTKHQSLFQKCVDMKNRGVKWIQSNSAVALVRDAFPESEGFEITEITARRAIHSRTPNATAQELIIQFK